MKWGDDMDTLYANKTTIKLWTDPYISKNMLEAHLDPYSDSASRKKETIIKTCKFIESFLSKSKTICDFGCGPGLYTNILNQFGYTVSGIDISKTSLEYAKSQNKYVRYIQQNYIDEPLDFKVDFIQMIYCDFGALSPYEQSRTLTNIKSSLNKGGLFFFDVMNDDFYESIPEETITYEENDGFFTKGEAHILKKVKKYEKEKVIVTHYNITGSKTFDLYNYDKCYNVLEMRNLLEENGFEIMNVYSDTTGSKVFNTTTLAFIAKVKNETR